MSKPVAAVAGAGRAAFAAAFPVPTARPFASLPLLLATCIATARAQSPAEFRFAYEDVLGSSCQIVVTAKDEASAGRAAAAVLAEVQRLASVCSQWDERSELMALIARGSGRPSTELRELLQLAASWRTRTAGAFEPGVATLTALWQAAARSGTRPDPAALAAAVAALREPAFTLAGTELTVHRPFTLDGVAKGHVLDRAGRAVATVPGATLVSCQIGGDTIVGAMPRDIALVDPRAPAANGTPLRTLRVANNAVASSGGYERGFDVDGKHHSHILDPRTGQPADAVLGASVIAKDLATADALATTLCVLGPEAGLRLLQQVDGADAIVITSDGKVHESPGFARYVIQAPDAADPATTDGGAWPAGFALHVEFTLKGPAANGGSRRGGWKRPYVAVWIEDATEAPARTLCLWLEDRRWLRDLRRWNRQYSDQPKFADTISQATRRPGNYTLQWDGKDDQGRVLASGRYTVLIEIVREHGTYQLMKQTLELGSEPLRATFDDNAEAEQARVWFGKARKGD